MASRTAPFPPADLDRRKLPIEKLVAGSPLYRIHRSGRGPIWFGPGAGKPAAYRFDAPQGEFGVCYLGRTPEASFAETFLRQPPVRLVTLGDLTGRSLATIHLKRTLRLAALHGPSLAKLGATAEVASGDYAVSRAWALALWQHGDDADGLIYRCRHDDASFAIALFDRAADALEHDSSAPLHLLSTLIGALARRYGFGLVP